MNQRLQRVQEKEIKSMPINFDLCRDKCACFQNSNRAQYYVAGTSSCLRPVICFIVFAVRETDNMTFSILLIDHSYSDTDRHYARVQPHHETVRHKNHHEPQIDVWNPFFRYLAE